MTSAPHEPSGCQVKFPNTPAGGEVKMDMSAHPRVSEGSGDTRRERQAEVDRRVVELRSQAAAKWAEAARIQDTVNSDYAFWTQPAYGNAAGRAFARQRDRERDKAQRAAGIAAEAKALSEKADRLEARGAVVAGDAAAAREVVIASCAISVGEMVDTTFYGIRRVIKVNRKTVVVEGPVNVGKEFVRPVRASA